VEYADFTKIKTSDFAAKIFDCPCGRRHEISTKNIIIGENALVLLKEVITKIMPAGKILFITDEASPESAAVEKILQGCFGVEKHNFPQGFKPDISCCAELLKHSEDIRLAVAYGGGEICSVAKHYGALSGRKVVMVPSVPSGEGYLSGISSLYVNGLKQSIAVPPVTALVCDTEIMVRSPQSHRAAGFGIICSKLTALLDMQFEKCMVGAYFCENVAALIKQSINICINEGEGLINENKKSIYALTDAFLRCSLAEQLQGNCICGGEHNLADMLKAVKYDLKPLLYGEKLFLAHKYITGLYKLFFTNKFTDLLPPPDKALHAEKLAQICGADYLYCLSKMNYDLSPQTYRMHGYKLEEYREELKGIIQLYETKTSAAAVIFKRMYSDAGFWINGAIKDKELTLSVALAADLNDRYTVLAHMRNMGIFEKYLK
jgi:glycerol-1-phosphate dehydrogenase [NAD(P)+]